MMLKVKAVLLAVALAGAVSACESAVSNDAGVDSTGAGNVDRLSQQDWVADSIGGTPVINPGRVTLSFAEGRVSGRSGCNLYSGGAEVGNGTLKVGALISTKMACGQDGLMQQEQAYLTALQSAQRYAFGADGKLTVATSNGALVYSSAPRQQRPEG